MVTKKEGKVYFLESHNLGKLTLSDLNTFALLSGIYKMFPSFSNEFVQHLLDKDVASAYLIKTHNFEDIGHKIESFKAIEKAIINKNRLSLVYRKQTRNVEPYKFANVKGIWYLIALQSGVIKTFTFTKISELEVCGDIFTIDNEIVKKIENEESLWFSNSKIEVILNVNNSIAHYFKRRKIITCQKILEEYEDGSLLVSTQMTFEEELLQIVKYWLPNIRIVSPLYLQEKLEDSLRGYLK